jgi:hypothetical protein
VATTLSIGYVRTFENNVRMIAQQRASLLRDWVQVIYKASERHLWPKVAAEEMGAKGSVTAATATPVADHVWTRRASVIATYAIGDLVQTNDISQMLVDPKSVYADSFGMAVARQIDNLIIDAATGAANTDHAATTASFPAGQEISDYSAEISFDLVAQVLELFNVNNVPLDEPKCFVIGPKQLRKLQGLVEYTSSDYAAVKALAETGFVQNWFGFTWIVSNLLNVPGGSQLDCLAFTRKAMGLHISEEPRVEVAKDPANSFDWRLYCQLSAGAVRIQDEHIVRFKAKDTVT